MWHVLCVAFLCPVVCGVMVETIKLNSYYSVSTIKYFKKYTYPNTTSEVLSHYPIVIKNSLILFMLPFPFLFASGRIRSMVTYFELY